MLRRFLQARREARDRVQRDAKDLLTFMGEPAYFEARERARSARKKADRTEDRHWGRVAVEIARRTDHRIGEKAADRYERPQEPTGSASPGESSSTLSWRSRRGSPTSWTGSRQDAAQRPGPGSPHR